MARFLSLVCLASLLIASFVEPVHQHHADRHQTSDDSTCLICHIAPTASAVVHYAAGIGPRLILESALYQPGSPRVTFPPSQSVRTPRAPPELAPTSSL